MSLQDSGADVVVELKNEFARRIFENSFRKANICPPLTIPTVAHPTQPGHTLATSGLIPVLKSTQLREITVGGVSHVVIDLTLKPSVGTITVDGQPASELTLPVPIAVSISQGKLSLQPDMSVVVQNPIVLAFLNSMLGTYVKPVSIELNMLNSASFSATPTDVAIKLVGAEDNLALGVDLNLQGTLLQFSGECPKTPAPVQNANLNGAAGNLAAFRLSYDTALIQAGDYTDVAVVVDEQVLAAKLKTVSIDRAGQLVQTRLWLTSAGPNSMSIRGQGCVYHHISCVGDWWDAGWDASARFTVSGGRLVISYTVTNAYLTDTDSGWGSCVDAVDELRKRGIDRGTVDLGIAASLGASSDPTGKLTVYQVQHRAHDAVLLARSDLDTLTDPSISVASELVIGPACTGKEYVADLTIAQHNATAGPLFVCGLQIEKDTGNKFSVVEPTGPFQLAPGQQKTVKVECSGPPGANYTADLRVLSNGGPAIVHLKALLADASFNYPPVLQLVGPVRLDLCTGQAYYGHAEDLTITNTGLGALRICDATILNDANNAFSVSYPYGQEPPSLVMPGATWRARVVFAPPASMLNQFFSAHLLLTTTLGSTTISLAGKLEGEGDYSDGGATGSFAHSVLCGKLLYEPPLKWDFPAHLLRDYVDLLRDFATERASQLFLELSLAGAPRGLRLEVKGGHGQVLAELGGRFHTKFLLFPYLEGAQQSVALSLRAGKRSEGRFVLRNWFYHAAGELATEGRLLDYAIRKDHILASTDAGLEVAQVGPGGGVRPAGRFEQYRARALATVGDRLLLLGEDVAVLNVALPRQPGELGRWQPEGHITGLYSPDHHVHHVDAELIRSGAYADVVYAYGQQLDVLRITERGTPERVGAAGLAEPPFRAVVWGHQLYLFGQKSVQRFDISQPENPVKSGEYQSDLPIVNGFVIGCMVQLVHEGPALTLLDSTTRDRLQKIGSYAPHPSLAALFPTFGPIFMDGRFLYTATEARDRVLVGRLITLPIEPERLEAYRHCRQ